MNIVTSYNIRLKTEYIRALKDTVTVYTDAVRYLKKQPSGYFFILGKPSL